MISIIATMLTGILLGYFLKDKKFTQHTGKTISLTIFTMLFIMGLNIGSNKELIENLGEFGWQAAIISVSATCGSILASWIIFRLFFKEHTQNQEQE